MLFLKEVASDLKKRIGYVLAALLLPLFLSGCMMTGSVEDLYAPPQLPVEYQALNAQIEQLLASGAEYTSPTSGANLQSVQLEDLDGDGVQEAIGFFRINSDERPMKIYIFRAAGDSYEQAAVIEGSGTAIHSIRYEDMNGDGVKEILVSWRVSTEVQAMAVYMLEDMEPVLAMVTAYARCEVMDLDGDEVQEIVVIRGDEADSVGSVAEYYDWEGSSLVLQSSARLSMSVAELQWVQQGVLRGGEMAVFVTGRVTGVEETSRAVTDILIYRQPDLTNIVLSSTTGVSSEIYRFLNLQPTDIDGDGITEVPMPASLFPDGEVEYWKVYWFSYDGSGQSEQEVITYHNQADSWYLELPEDWDGCFTVRQTTPSAAERRTTFYNLNGWIVKEELFTISALTGSNREAQAKEGGRIILRKQPNAIYTVEFSEEYGQWRSAISEEEFADRFAVILTQWTTEE